MLVSEELGERRFGSDPTLRVIVDPIDGSVNAKPGIPFFSLSVAVADRPRWGTWSSATSTTSEAARSGSPSAERRPARRLTASRRRARGRDRVLSFEARGRTSWPTTRRPASRGADADHGLARPVALPSRGGPDRRGRLAEADPERRHRGGPASLRERGIAIELPDGGAFGDAPLDVVSRSRVVAGPDPGRVRAAGGTARGVSFEIRADGRRRIWPWRAPSRVRGRARHRPLLPALRRELAGLPGAYAPPLDACCWRPRPTAPPAASA